jgi:hypothetical protein
MSEWVGKLTSELSNLITDLIPNGLTDRLPNTKHEVI